MQKTQGLPWRLLLRYGLCLLLLKGLMNEQAGMSGLVDKVDEVDLMV